MLQNFLLSSNYWNDRALLCLLAFHCSYDLLFVLSETLESLEGCFLVHLLQHVR